MRISSLQLRGLFGFAITILWPLNYTRNTHHGQMKSFSKMPGKGLLPHFRYIEKSSVIKKNHYG